MNKNLLKESYKNHKVGKIQMNIYETGYDIPYHWHDEYEFIYVKKGNCLCMVNGDSFTVGEGDAILISAGELHTVAPYGGGEFFAAVIHPYMCGAECSNLFSGNITFNHLFSHKNQAESFVIEELLELYDVFMAKNYAYELKLKSKICSLFSLLFELGLYGDTAGKHSRNMGVFEDLIEYIHSNYSEDITLDRLAEISNYSKPYVIKLFKENAGKTPFDYINRYRVYKAQEMLINTEKSIIEIALECGFCNIGYFNKLFKRYLGATPGSFRKTER